jgi:archaemetzincin
MKIILLIIILVIFSALFFQGSEKRMGMIKIVFLNYKEPTLERYLSEILTARFRTKIQIFYDNDLPKNAFSSRRKQYNAEILINVLLKYKDNESIILGIIDEDLYIEKFNFIFGLANHYDRTAIVGLARLRQQFYGLPADNNLFFKRVGKEAVHEIGHVYGLSHCHIIKCVMHFSNTLGDTDIKDDDFCDQCKKQLQILNR